MRLLFGLVVFVLWQHTDCLTRTTKLLTLNTFLINIQTEYQKRAEHIANNIGSTQADIICLQEVWDDKDVLAIVKANQEKYPYTLSGLHNETQELLQSSKTNRPRCLELGVLVMAIRTVANGCLGEEGDAARLKCLMEKAGYLDLSRQCIACLTFSGFDIGSLLKNCLFSNIQTNLPGLLVLSKRKLLNPSMTYFRQEKTLFNRGYISFEVDQVGDIRCTHQTSDSLGDYYDGNLRTVYGSWEDQHFDETKTLISSFPNDKIRSIIMGDVNTGPFLPIQTELQGYFIDSYKYYKSQMFMPTFETTCTYCLENPLAMDIDSGSIIDQVLVRTPEGDIATYKTMRVFDNLIPGETVPASDHYAVELLIETPSH
ncbi:uncharacterized protein LOC125660040 [Ostrea edulis]|uniref:uncharacterized protein LOC125660040 n=1 Tax=Ostrea edulis TaxID=37623 RepID=UPI0024AEE470|nr:uncharacterized protein LOC125660040 [Ostrea edulis]